MLFDVIAELLELDDMIVPALCFIELCVDNNIPAAPAITKIKSIITVSEILRFISQQHL
jgi:hypothetical protein